MSNNIFDDIIDNAFPDKRFYHKHAQETSKESYESAKKYITGVRGEVLTFFSKGWALTPDEAAAKIEIGILTVRPQCSALLSAGFLEILLDENGHKVRRPNDVSGKNAMVHLITKKGIELVRLANSA